MCLQSDKKLSNVPPPCREGVLSVCSEFTGTIIKLEVAIAMQQYPRGVHVLLWCYTSKICGGSP